MADEEEAELSETQKKEIAKWFLLNSPPGEIQYVAKGNLSLYIYIYSLICILNFVFFFCLVSMADVKAILDDDELYEEAAAEAFPLCNKSHMISLELPGRTGDV